MTKTSWISPAEGALRLAKGEIIVTPTETVWGLAAPLASAPVLFQLKGRDSTKAAALAFSTVGAAKDSLIFTWSEEAEKLAARFLPGPLTIILPALAANLPSWILGSEGGVGLRVPDCDEARDLLSRHGEPVVLTSANRSGEASPSGPFPDDLFPELARVRPDIWPGASPSTVVSLLKPEPRVLREGSLSASEVLQCLGL